MLHSPEYLTVQIDDEERNVRFNHCDAWHFLGLAAGKAKSSDHVFYNTCFEYTKSQYDHVTAWIVWSYNCSCQYKCQQNFIRIAEAPIGGRSVSHRFAMVGQFKGPHDGAGKVFNQGNAEIFL